MRYVQWMDTITGPIRLVADEDALTELGWSAYRLRPPGAALAENEVLARAKVELNEYFAGERKTFTVPLRLIGTPFQQAVWAALCEIPYGETRSYGQIAARIGKPKAARAVGQANHFNPVAIIVPCHRVVGADGALTGFGGGLDVKQRLLALERAGAAEKTRL